MNTPNAVNIHQNADMVENRSATVTQGWLHAFVAQTDWHGPVWEETFYGHHAPCRRFCLWLLFPFVLFPVLAPWLVQATNHARLLDLVDVPILLAPALQPKEELPYVLDPDFSYEEFEYLTTSCIDAARRFASDTRLSCHFEDDDDETDDENNAQAFDHKGSDEIALPVECQRATRIMLNPKSSSSSSSKETHNQGAGHAVRAAQGDGDQHTEESRNEGAYTLLHSLRLSKEECTIEFLDSAGVSRFMLIVAGNDGPVDNVLESLLDEGQVLVEYCAFLPIIDARSLFDSRREMIIFAGAVFFCMVVLLDILLVMNQLIISTFVVRLLLPKMSKDYGVDEVTFWSTWKAFLLMTALTETKHCLFGDKTFVLMTIPAAMAFYYREHRASWEWAFLGVLSYGFESVHPWLDRVTAAVLTVDTLGIVYSLVSWVGIIVPGEGWYKLVRVYVFVMAYPPVRQSVWWQWFCGSLSDPRESPLGENDTKDVQPPVVVQPENEQSDMTSDSVRGVVENQ